MLNKADLAKEAERLLKDQYLEYALDAIRKDTCEALLTADVSRHKPDHTIAGQSRNCGRNP
jgi:hypothetical protein